mgnify:CR=1 FL=1
MGVLAELIKFGGVLTFSAAATTSMFFTMRFLKFFSRIEENKEKFEDLWKENIDKTEHDETLASLSYTHKALKRQLEELEEINAEHLERAIQTAEENKKIMTGNRTHHLYYAASEKLQELRREAKHRGKI